MPTRWHTPLAWKRKSIRLCCVVCTLHSAYTTHTPEVTVKTHELPVQTRSELRVIMQIVVCLDRFQTFWRLS